MVLHGAAGRAPTRLNRGGDVCRGSWRHGLLRGEHADEDQLPLTVRTDPRLDRRHRLHGAWYERWSGRAALYQVRLRRRLQLQHLPYPVLSAFEPARERHARAAEPPVQADSRIPSAMAVRRMW